MASNPCFPKEKYGAVALLPIKANSDRIKGKNFRDFCGRPLYRWVLDTLLEITEIDLVVINTDAKKILAAHGLLESQRVRIRDRRAEICGDSVSMNLILADDVANVPADIYLMTHATNPLLSTKTIYRAIEDFRAALANGKADSLFTVNRLHARLYRMDCTPLNHNPRDLIRTQDLEPWFEENSNLYIFTAESFARTNARIGQKPIMYETPKLESVDIDTPEDWFIAEALAHRFRQNDIVDPSQGERSVNKTW